MLGGGGAVRVGGRAQLVAAALGVGGVIAGAGHIVGLLVELVGGLAGVVGRAELDPADAERSRR
jgi:hypothetical protein